jgi:fatty-acyl-CoA synthase
MLTEQCSCTKNLASYAMPMFLRLSKEIEVTPTFKHKKTELVKVGCCWNRVQSFLRMLIPIAGGFRSLCD